MDPGRAQALLDQRRSELENLIAVATEQGSLDQPQSESSGDTTTVDQHPADTATDTHERELDLSVRETAEASLRDVERARDRLAKGTYGVCPVCEEPIPDERLEIRPEAEFCVQHTPAAAAG